MAHMSLKKQLPVSDNVSDLAKSAVEDEAVNEKTVNFFKIFQIPLILICNFQHSNLVAHFLNWKKSILDF